MQAQNNKTPQQVLEQLLIFIDDEKINVKVEALKTFISFVQSDIAYVNMIENQFKKAIVSLISLIQHKEEVSNVHLCVCVCVCVYFFSHV